MRSTVTVGSDDHVVCTYLNAEDEAIYFPYQNIADVNTDTYDLSVKNPNKKEEAPLREPQDILDEIAMLDEESEGILTNIRRLL